MKNEKDVERFRVLILLGISGGFLYLFVLTALPFLVPAIWALILVTTTWPIYRRLLRAFPKRNTLCAAIMTLSACAVLLGVVGPLVTILAHEVSVWRTSGASPIESFFQKVPDLAALPYIGPLLSRLGLSEELSRDSVLEFVRNYHSLFTQYATLAASAFLSAFTTLFLCIFLSFFFYRDAGVLLSQVKRVLVGVGGGRFRGILQTCRDTVRGAVYGTLATALAQGILAGLGFFVVGNSYPVLLGVLTAALSFAPLGAPLTYVPVVISLFAEGRYFAGIGLLAWGVGVVSTCDNVLRSLFISQSTEMSVLLVFIGIVGGVLAFGLLGLVLGPVIMAVAQGVWIDWVRQSEESGSALSESILHT